MTNPYKPTGAAIPKMLGRRSVMDELCGVLENNNVSVVGPKRYGKTVLLNALRDRMMTSGSKFAGVAWWDLRASTPKNDEEFRKHFALSVKSAVDGIDSSLGEHLTAGSAEPLEWVAFALDELAKAGKRVLVIIDRFDAIEISDDGIGPNLLGELRILASEKHAMRLVVSSRRSLREQCMTPEAKSSDFHRVFEKLSLGGFSEADLEDCWIPLSERGIAIDKGAKTELRNWTGGVPPLVTLVLGVVCETLANGSHATDALVKEAAASVLSKREEELAELWVDCPIDIQSALAETATRAVGIGELRKEYQRAMQLRQIGRIQGDQVHWNCTLLQKFVDPQHGGPINALRVLFGTPSAASKNFPRVLEHLQSLTGLKTEELSDEVSAAILDLKTEPRKALNRARSIRDAALDIVWFTELQTGVKIPSSWQAEWHSKTGQFFGPPWLDGASAIPDDRSQQVTVLRQATGTKDVKKVTTKVSKQTYTLIGFLHEAGNLQYHRASGETISEHFARAVCCAAVELCGRLQVECGA